MPGRSKGQQKKLPLNLCQNCDVYFEDANVNCDPDSVLNADRIDLRFRLGATHIDPNI